MATNEDAPRKVLQRALRPLLPAQWRIVPTQQSVAEIKRTVVKLSQQRISRHPVAPAAAHVVEFVATVYPPNELIQSAEDQLDDDVNAFLHALDRAGILWTEAEKVRVAQNDDRLGYDIKLSTVTQTTTTKE